MADDSDLFRGALTLTFWLNGRDRLGAYCSSSQATHQFSTNTVMTLRKAKRRAYKLRQEDTGWGRAAAHLIPLYQVHYVRTRATLTPLLYAVVLQVMTAFVLGLLSPEKTAFFTNLLAPERTDEWYVTKALQLAISPFLFIGYGSTSVACVLAALVGVKLGINQARQHAHRALETEDQNEEPKPTSHSPDA